MDSASSYSFKLAEGDGVEAESEKMKMCLSPDSPRRPVKSNAVVKYSTARSLANFACLQCNTDLNMPPSNWLSSSAESYGLQPVPSDSSGFSSFLMAHMFPDCVGEVDVVSDAENIKKLLKIPYSETPVSMMIHRVENTLLIDEFDIHRHLMRTAETEWEWLKKFFFDHVLNSLSTKEKGIFHKNNSRYSLQQKSLISKFLYHSLAVAESQEDQLQLKDNSNKERDVPLPMPLAEPILPEPRLEEKLPDPSFKHEFARNFVWTFEDIQMLIGTNLPIFGGTTHPCISLKLRDVSKPINVLTGIDYWLDNLMCNVPELVMCYHLNGIVQKYELIKTEDLPHLENSKFSPKVIRDVAQNILSFLKSNATKAGHTYWLFKGKNDDAVKLYDLTSLCTDVLDEKEQNPFTVPVAMLLYRVARNMKHSPESQRQKGTIRMLLKNCVALLPKEKYPQIVTSAHYMLSDLYLPADTDPVSPELSNDLDDCHSSVGLNKSECEVVEKDKSVGRSSVAVKSLFVSTSDRERVGEAHTKYSTPPFICSVEERCKLALQHVAMGLNCLQYFEVEDRQNKADQEKKMQDLNDCKEESQKMAKPFEAIPMPYSPLESASPELLTKDPQTSPIASSSNVNKRAPSSRRKRKDSRPEATLAQNKIGNTKSSGGDAEQIENSPKTLLCKSKAKQMPTWQLHLKVLLYEKACLVYATLAEKEYASLLYGRSLHYISLVLRCHGVFEQLSNSVPNVGLHSYLLGRAGDCCFMMVQNWSRIESYKQDYIHFTEVDSDIMEEIKKDTLPNGNKSQIDFLPITIDTLEQMLSASCECYQEALALEPLEQQKSNLRRRLGNILNELGVLHMNKAAARYQEEASSELSTSEFQSLFSQSLNYLDQGICAFEAEGDKANLALLHSNTGRLMRMCAHYHSPDARTELVGQERHYYNKALTSYQKALLVLGSRKSNRVIWDTVTWELSTTLFTMATLLQDYPTAGLKSLEEMEREVVDFLRKALNHCDLETQGSRQPVYQFRAASIHHRLASFYHKSYRNLPADDPKHKNLLQLARLHYDKASALFLSLEHPSEFLRVQIEIIALWEYLAQNTSSVNTKLKWFQQALELVLQCVPILNVIVVDRGQSTGARETDDSSSSNTKNVRMLHAAGVRNNGVEERSDGSRINTEVECYQKNCEERPDVCTGNDPKTPNKTDNPEDIAEQEEEYKLVKLLEQRIQFILLKLTHLCTSSAKPNQNKLDNRGECYKNLYTRSLRKYSDDSVYGIATNLLSILSAVADTPGCGPNEQERKTNKHR